MSLVAYVRSDGAALLRFAYLLCRDRGRAEDLVQDALLKLHRRGVDRVVNLPAYTRRIVVTEYLGWRRRRWSTELVVDADTMNLAMSERFAMPGTERRLLFDDVLDAFDGLSVRQRTVLVLRYYEDLPDAEIGELLGCSAATVRSVAARALSRIHDRLRSSTTSVGETP